MRRDVRYYLITTDQEKLPADSTWFVMTNLEGKIMKQVGNTYGMRTWIEYGLKQCKNELGWADYRLSGLCEYRAVVGNSIECLFDGERDIQNHSKIKGSAKRLAKVSTQSTNGGMRGEGGRMS